MESTQIGPNQDDANWFADYQRRWQNGSLTVDHPVVFKVKRLSRVVAYRFGNRELADDLEQNCLMALSETEFRADSKLDTFIVTILINLIRREWRKRGGNRQREIVEMPDTSSEEVLEIVFGHVSSERWMKKLVSENSDVRTTVLTTIVEADKIIGRKRIAEIATAKLGRKVTRHQVEVILRQLRDNLRNGGSDGSWA